MVHHAGTRRLSCYGLFALLVAIMAVFMIWPIILTVRGGFVDGDGRFTISYLLLVFRQPVYLAGLTNSISIACCTTLLCLAIAMPLAILAARFEFRGKAAVTSLIMVPLILPPFVGAIGIKALFGRFGTVNTLLAHLGMLDPSEPGIDFLGGAVGGRFWSIVVMEALHLYPILYLNLTAALANVDPTMEQAAEGLGAGRWRRFWRVTVPLTLPGIFAGTTIVFIWSFTELGTPLMFDYYDVTPVQIFWGITQMHASPQPYALVAVMLAVSVLCYLVGRAVIGRRGYAMSSKASIAASPRMLTGIRSLVAMLAFAVIIAAAILPHIGVIFTSVSADGAWYRSILPDRFTLEHYHGALSHSLAVGAIRNSLVYASLATVLCVAIGLAVSYLNVRVRMRGGALLDALAMMPLAVPGLVMAFGYVAMSLHWPFVDTPLQRWVAVVGADPNPVPLLIIAYAIRRLPYVVRSVSAGLEQTAVATEEAAHNLGASTLTTLRRITVPLIAANLIAGGILAFSFAMLEVSDSLILAQKQQHYPITKAIFELFNRLGDGPYIASAMGVWAMALLATALIAAAALMGKRLGTIFRI